MNGQSKERTVRVHIRCTINGEPARILLQLKDRGIIRSYVDGVCQGLLALWREVLSRELEEARLMASKHLEQEGRKKLNDSQDGYTAT